jgi:hypothetical protein
MHHSNYRRKYFALREIRIVRIGFGRGNYRFYLFWSLVVAQSYVGMTIVVIADCQN